MTLLVADIDWERGFQRAWDGFSSFLLDALGFIAILVIGFVVAKVVAKVFESILERLGFDRAVERGGIKKFLERSRYDASDVVAKIVFYVLFLFVLLLAFNVFGPNPVSFVIAEVIAYLPKILIAILIIVILSAVAAGVKEIVSIALGNLAYGPTLGTVASIIIVTLGIFMALEQLGVAEDTLHALWIAVLAIVAGSAIVAIGGGGIQPMRERWERALNRIDEEAPRIRDEAEASKELVQQHLQQRMDELRPQPEPPPAAQYPQAGYPQQPYPPEAYPQQQYPPGYVPPQPPAAPPVPPGGPTQPLPPV